MENNNINKNELIINLENYSLITTLKIHNNIINCIIQLNDKRLASCSEDNTIKIYNQNTYSIDINIIENNNKIISILQLSNNNLISSNKKNIKEYIINNNNYQLISIFYEDITTIYKLIELKNENLLTCTLDGNINIWKKSFNDEYNVLYSNCLTDYCYDILEIRSNILAICENIVIKIFDLNYYYTIYKIHLKDKAKNFCLLNYNILVVNESTIFEIIDLNSVSIIKNIKKKLNEKNNIYVKDNNIFISNEFGMNHYLFNNNELTLKHYKNKMHNNYINYINILDDNTLITIGRDNLIKIWKSNI